MSDPIVFHYQPDRMLSEIDPEQISGLLVGDVWYPVALGERVGADNTVKFHVGVPERVTVVSA